MNSRTREKVSEEKIQYFEKSYTFFSYFLSRILVLIIVKLMQSNFHFSSPSSFFFYLITLLFDFDYSSSLRDRFSLNDTNIFKYSKVKKLHDSQKRTNYSQIFRTLIHYHFLFRQIYSVQKRAQSNIPVTFNDNSAKLRQSKGNKRHLSSR